MASGSSLQSFVIALLSQKKLDRTFSMEEKAFHGKLLKSMQRFEEDMRGLLPHFEKIFQRLVILQHTKYSERTGWSDHWKVVSYKGYDVFKGRCVDYGNMEYFVLVRVICHRSSYCYSCMEWLGTEYFGSLHPEAEVSEHAVEMHGDIFEICMAALRGDLEFKDVLPEGIELQAVFAKLCEMCRLIHMLDACLRTGRIKWQSERAPRLTYLRPDLANHSFVQIWGMEDPEARADALSHRR